MDDPVYATSGALFDKQYGQHLLDKYCSEQSRLVQAWCLTAVHDSIQAMVHSDIIHGHLEKPHELMPYRHSPSAQL